MVGRKREWSDSEKAQIKDLYEVQGKTAGAIATIMDIQPTTIHRAIGYWGLKKPSATPKKPKAPLITPEHQALREKIKPLWLEGKSCLQIARLLSSEGKSYTRNVILGHVTRMQLPHRSPETKSLAARKPKPFNMPPQHGLGGNRAVRPEPSKINTLALIDPCLLNGEFVTIETVSDRTCRYPIGDPAQPGFHFCGHKPKTGKSYCEFHAERCYTPTTNQSNVDQKMIRNSGINRALG